MGRCSSSTFHTEPDDEVHYTLTRHLNPSNLIRHRWPTPDRRCVQTSISKKRNLADSSDRFQEIRAAEYCLHSDLLEARIWPVKVALTAPGLLPHSRPLARSISGRNGASQYSSFSNYPPELSRVSGMPIKIKDRPFKFVTRL